jgi:predicted membrane metal-binding protein
MLVIIALVLVAIVALAVIGFAVHLLFSLFSPLLLVAVIGILAWIAFRRGHARQ